MRAARVRNKELFDRTHRLQPRIIEEGDWFLVYETSLDNHHKAMRKFARRWFGPYVVTSANDNRTGPTISRSSTGRGWRYRWAEKGSECSKSSTRSNRTRTTWIATTIGSERMMIQRMRDKHGPVFLGKSLVLAHTGGFAVRWGRMSWRKPSLSGIGKKSA